MRDALKWLTQPHGALAFALACSLDVSAQPLQSAQKAVRIVRTASPPTLDGKLDDPAWTQAGVIDDMHQYDPVDHGVPSERTVVYLLYDDDNLYIGARMYDSEPDEITARQMIVGQTMQWDDSIGIYLDSFNNKRTAYNFQVNPNGNRADGLFETPTEINRDWDGIWDAEALIDEEGWTAEMVIPFKTLNFDPGNPNWGFTVERTIARKQEEIAWVSYNRRVNPGASGLITGLTGLQQGRGIDVVPSIVMTDTRDVAAGTNDTNSQPSLDVFYNITPSLTAMLTLNTDFSTTEVDDRQINLTRFSLFFPEKRDFFLQDMDIFSYGGLSENGIPFFSRRIGLSEGGEPVDLDIGAKVTGRIGRWNIGVLDVRQAEFQGVDNSNLFVGRVAANVLSESSVGMIMTNGDPRSDLENSVIGVDFRYRNNSLPSGQALEGELWYQTSDTEGLTGDDVAWGVRFASPNSEGIVGELAYDHIEANFNPALGFVNRSGVNRSQLDLGYVLRPERGWIRSAQTSFNYESFDRISGSLESSSLFAELLEIETITGETFGVQLNRDREVLLVSFEISEGVVVAPGDYRFARYGLEASGAAERIFAPRVEFDKGEFFDGDIFTVEAGFDWRPTRHFFLSFGYEYNDVELPGGDFVARLIQMQANYAFNVRWSWMNLLQYDNESQSTGINSRLRWNPRAGQDLYIVLNHGLDSGGFFSGFRTRDSQLSVKYTYTFRL